MKQIISLGMIVFISLGMYGCGEEETKSVEYYVKNDGERVAKIQECKNNLEELKNTPNCINAFKADFIKFNTSTSGGIDHTDDQKPTGRDW